MFNDRAIEVIEGLIQRNDGDISYKDLNVQLGLIYPP
jgi:hypothetical protein